MNKGDFKKDKVSCPSCGTGLGYLMKKCLSCGKQFSAYEILKLAGGILESGVGLRSIRRQISEAGRGMGSEILETAGKIFMENEEASSIIALVAARDFGDPRVVKESLLESRYPFASQALRVEIAQTLLAIQTFESEEIIKRLKSIENDPVVKKSFEEPLVTSDGLSREIKTNLRGGLLWNKETRGESIKESVNISGGSEEKAGVGEDISSKEGKKEEEKVKELKPLRQEEVLKEEKKVNDDKTLEEKGDSVMEKQTNAEMDSVVVQTNTEDLSHKEPPIETASCERGELGEISKGGADNVSVPQLPLLDAKSMEDVEVIEEGEGKGALAITDRGDELTEEDKRSLSDSEDKGKEEVSHERITKPPPLPVEKEPERVIFDVKSGSSALADGGKVAEKKGYWGILIMAMIIALIGAIIGYGVSEFMNKKDTETEENSSKKNDKKSSTEGSFITKIEEREKPETQNFASNGKKIQPVSHILASKVSASSFHPRYPPGNVVDGNPATVWQEEKTRKPIGEWLKFEFSNNMVITRVGIVAGYDFIDEKGKDYYPLNCRLKEGEFLFSHDKSMKFTLNDVRAIQYIDINPPVVTTEIRLVVYDVFKGSWFFDNAIGEVEIWGYEENEEGTQE